MFLDFDGAFRSALVFCNGNFIGRNDNGYVPFRFDLTDFLFYGEKNCITVRMDASLAMAGSTRALASIGMCG